VTASALAASGRPERAPGAPIRRGERATEVAVAGGEALTGAPPGTRVDVIVTTESRTGGASGRTFLALQDVELLGARAAGGDAGSATGGDGAAAHATTIATLRVTLREAVYLTAAQSFARELRLLIRAPGDRHAARPLAVDAGGL
jgi:pilus assembly protein CpaB